MPSLIAQAVSRPLPIAAARVRARFRSCGICGGQISTGAGVLQVLRFPLPSIQPIAPHLSFIHQHPGLYNRPLVASVIMEADWIASVVEGSESLATDPEARFRFPALPEKVVGLKRGPLSLVSTTEELLDRNVAAPV
jgi:hypothetical protein